MDLKDIYRDVDAELTAMGKRIRDHINKRHPLTGMMWSLTHNDKVSNTHCCPRNGVTNWGGRDKAPTSYPGWEGRLWLRYEGVHPRFGNEPVEDSGLHTGTGGFGDYNGPWKRGELYSWDCKLFDADFPKLITKLETAVAQQLLYHGEMGREDWWHKGVCQHRHEYYWISRKKHDPYV